MATPTVRQAVASAATAGSTSVTLGATTAVGDLLLIFNGADWDTAASMNAPTFSQAVTGLTLQATADNGANQAHIKLWTAVTTVAGTQTVTVNVTNTGAELSGHVVVIDGSTVNTGAFIDGTVTTGGTVTAATAQVAPAVVPTTADALLVCMAQSDGNTTSVVTYTAPTGMTERTDVTDGAFTGASVATQVLAASGTTGTKTFTASAAHGYSTVSIAVRGGAAGPAAPPPLATFIRPG